ncbi:hypothetical protein CJP74_06445 [Psittacicella melopsittaci]|uniref:Uncharacterized protein n=1 Tax=Psittacicella melopsittaci TaxID=2028576 RepID=A0A3A1Y2V1_9GAMM|nr:hypothetical protein [Psittacicella melopsittaci]RIY31750.1 hypothetical protein CJP74_06445 [Psittacicella melopsittaci]
MPNANNLKSLTELNEKLKKQIEDHELQTQATVQDLQKQIEEAKSSLATIQQELNLVKEKLDPIQKKYSVLIAEKNDLMKKVNSYRVSIGLTQNQLTTLIEQNKKNNANLPAIVFGLGVQLSYLSNACKNKNFSMINQELGNFTNYSNVQITDHLIQHCNNTIATEAGFKGRTDTLLAAEQKLSNDIALFEEVKAKFTQAETIKNYLLQNQILHGYEFNDHRTVEAKIEEALNHQTLGEGIQRMTISYFEHLKVRITAILIFMAIIFFFILLGKIF